MVAVVPTGAVLSGCAAPDIATIGPIAITWACLGNAPAGHRAQPTPTQLLKSHSITLPCITTASNDTIVSRT